MISLIEIGWAAGFLEGDGWFRFEPYAGRSEGCGRPYVAAGQVNREPIERLMRLFGGHKSHQQPSASNRRRWNSRKIWIWMRGGPAAVGLMMTIYREMSRERQAKIRSVLERWRHAPGRGSWDRNKTHCPKGHAYAEHAVRRKTTGYRSCRLCHRAANRHRYAVNRDVINARLRERRRLARAAS